MALDTEQTALWTMNNIVWTLAKQLMDSQHVDRNAFKADLEALRRDVSQRSDLDYAAAKQLLEQYLRLADPDWQAP
ncbi:MAG: hypothetical protein AB1430_16800 [Pseudomonadota bacterium]